MSPEVHRTVFSLTDFNRVFFFLKIRQHFTMKRKIKQNPIRELNYERTDQLGVDSSNSSEMLFSLTSHGITENHNLLRD